ncbi:hypothetical protein ACIPC1_35130 [Streptomyces sp. NPDC087263]|uniref:hypothetical protein n=1 Tax=Streptomyces sp. NPDC087263 TaxID=3365773 RepID=UPI0038036524
MMQRGAMGAVWRIWRDDELLGTLREFAVDQPVFVCRFEPTEVWATVKPYFDDLSEVPRPDADGLRTAQVVKKILDLGLILEDADSGEHLENYFLTIKGDVARLRC